MENKKKFKVTICRTTVYTRDYEVEADNAGEADDLAHEQAGNDEWPTNSNVEYDTDSVEELK